MKQFDDKFSRKAKEAFDNFNADHLAEAGWNSYEKKYGTGNAPGHSLFHSGLKSPQLLQC
ncbi:MAG: hypothetical protein MZV63_49010 [Marinilabiliales bacterium]|nr:hypothetical protein [Marinilabiliales bacterium]